MPVVTMVIDINH